LTIDPLAIADIKVLETINDGHTVFQHADLALKTDVVGGEHADLALKTDVVGGDRDEHGCIPSAGYQWCEKLGKCVRPWELEVGDTTGEISQEDFEAYCKSS
jgi:hypothetical protein